jgi:hypothetical protein
MAEPHHKKKLEQTCEIVGCNEPAERSVSTKSAQSIGLSVPEDVNRRVHLCKKHYKEYKKKTKKDRELERLGW